MDFTITGGVGGKQVNIEVVTQTTTWRTITLADIPDIQILLGDWEHGPQTFVSPRVIENEVYKWMNFMADHPKVYPVVDDSFFMDCFICYQGINPLAFIQVICRGKDHPPGAGEPIPRSSLTLAIMAINPQFRGQGFHDILIDELVSNVFEVSAMVDVVYVHSATSVGDNRIDTSGRINSEDLSKQSAITGKIRRRIVVTQQDYETFVTANPSKRKTTSIVIVP